MTELWIADWIFYHKRNKWDKKIKQLVVKDVITKNIPLIHILNDRLQYNRAIRDLEPKTMASLEDDPLTGKKKFKIQYTKKITDI